MSARWIIGRNADLLWLTGGTLAGWTLFLAHSVLRVNMFHAWLLWTVLLSGPHLFATYTRTYLAPDEWRRRGRLLLGSLGLFLVGPAVLLLCGGLALSGAPWHRAPFAAFLALATLWAFWHMVRQHYGILRLYQRKNADEATADRRADAWLLHAGLLAPLIILITRHPEARTPLGLPPIEPGSTWEPVVHAACFIALAVSVALFLGRQFLRWRRGGGVNGPKIVFLAVLLPYYFFVCTRSELLSAPLLGVIPVLIVPHDIQYLALVRYYNRNREREFLGRQERPDVGCRISGSVPLYGICAVGTGVVLGLLACTLDGGIGVLDALRSSTPILFGVIGLRDILLATLQGFFIHHFFIDQFLWKPGRDAHVAGALELAAPAPR